MLHEKPGNDFHWKSKLEELESLLGETFNKDAAWEKLHERMQGKHRNKKALWYWSAAACLLSAIMISWLFLTNKNETILVKNNPVPKQTQSALPHLLNQNKTDRAIVISSLSNEKKSPPLSVEKSNKINSVFKHDILQLKPVGNKEEKEEFITQKITINAALPVTTAISIVATIPEKKKLKVVHINELGDPVTESPNIARSHDHRSLVKFINREINTSLPSSGNTGFNIFKTKTVPSN